MKKLHWGVLILIILLGSCWFWWPEEQVQKAQRTKDQAKVTATNSTKVSEKVEEGAQQEPQKSEATSESEESSKPVEEPSCYERYQRKPEWKEIEAVLSSIYMNGDEAAGQGIYQQLPIEAVKSYADTGDKDAMFHYGSEVMWKAAFGVHLNSVNRNPGEPLSQLRQRAKKHKPDVDNFLLGAGYAYRAAVQGKLGGLLEIVAGEKMLIKRMVQSGSSSENIEKALMHRHAALSLMQTIHADDPGLLMFFSSDDEFEEDLAVIYSEQEIQPELREKLQNKIKHRSERLLQKWKSDRQILGLEPFPDVMRPKLDEFLNSMEQECNS